MSQLNSNLAPQSLDDPRRLSIGEAFNPWRGACGFYPPDAVSRLQPLTVIATRRRFSDGQKRLYTLLVRRSGRNGQCFPGQGDLATALGKSERAIRRWLEDLEAFGLIGRQCRGRSKGGNGQTDSYTFLWHPIFDQTSLGVMTGHNALYDRPESAIMTGQNRQPLYKEEACTVETRRVEARKDAPASSNETASEERLEHPPVVPTSPRHGLLQPAGYAFDEQYADFRAACRDWGLNVIDEDFLDAWPEWRVLDFERRRDAIQGIHARKLAGKDPSFVRNPKNYLRGHEWKRPLTKSATHAAPPVYQNADDYIRRLQAE
jgi:hypothetical protein